MTTHKPEFKLRQLRLASMRNEAAVKLKKLEPDDFLHLEALIHKEFEAIHKALHKPFTPHREC